MALDRIILDGAQAYAVDGAALSDVLTAGYSVKDAPRIIKGYAAATHTIALVVAAATVRALHMVYAAKTDPAAAIDLAIWKVYYKIEGVPEYVAGYLTIEVTADSTIASIDSSGTLGTEKTTLTAATAVFQAWVAETQYEDMATVSTDLTAAKAKLRFEA